MVRERGRVSVWRRSVLGAGRRSCRTRYPLLPASGLPREPGWQRRLLVRNRFVRLSRRGADLSLEFFLVGQAGELVYEHQGLVRRDLESLAAGRTRDLVVDAKQVVAQLGELGPVDLVGTGRRLVPLRVSRPSDAVFTGPSTPGALIPPRSSLQLFGEQGAFVEGHSGMVANGWRRYALPVKRSEESAWRVRALAASAASQPTVQRTRGRRQQRAGNCRTPASCRSPRGPRPQAEVGKAAGTSDDAKRA